MSCHEHDQHRRTLPDRMNSMPATVEYIYWSDRRTKALLNGKNIPISVSTTKTVSSPAMKWFPSFSRSSTFDESPKPQLAKLVEGALRKDTVSGFNLPGRIKYAKGIGNVVFGEFVTWLVDKQGTEPAVMFTACDYDNGDRGSVAVPLWQP